MTVEDPNNPMNALGFAIAYLATIALLFSLFWFGPEILQFLLINLIGLMQ